MGARIANLRKRKGYSQDDLAKLVGVSKQTISNWETDTKSPKMGYIESLANIFSTSKSFIIDGDLTVIDSEVNLDKALEEDLPMMYQGKPVSDLDKELIKRILEGGKDE